MLLPSIFCEMETEAVANIDEDPVSSFKVFEGRLEGRAFQWVPSSDPKSIGRGHHVCRVRD